MTNAKSKTTGQHVEVEMNHRQQEYMSSNDGVLQLFPAIADELRLPCIGHAISFDENRKFVVFPPAIS